MEVDTEGGVVVDHMVTSDPDIYPARDICSASWELSENWIHMDILFNIHPGSNCGKMSRDRKGCIENFVNVINIAQVM